MILEGLTINFMGDSITEGHGTSSPEQRFTNILEKRCHLKAANNYGISGTRFAIQRKPSQDPRHDLHFCGRYDKMAPDADIVAVFGGTNDFGHGDAPIGKFADHSDDTFCGACRVLMEGLLNRYPASRVVFLTPLHRLNEDDPCGDCKENDTGTLSDYVDAIREAARYYSLPVLDLFASSGIQPRVPRIRKMYCPDGLHPNDAGHILLADRICAFLTAL